MEVRPPRWRTDIHIKEDVIEEIGRLLGYDNIQPVLPKHGTAEPNAMMLLKTKIRRTLAEFGMNEVLTYSFVSEKLLEKAGQMPKNSYKIVNSISPELQYIRQSIVPSLLDKAYINQKVPFDKFALFEMNKVYQKKWGMDAEGVPVEKMRLGLVIAERKTTGAAYYAAKMYVENLCAKLNLPVRVEKLDLGAAEALPFEPKRAAKLVTEDGTIIGACGEFKNSVRRNFKLAEYLAGAEIDLDAVLRLAGAPREVKIVTRRETRDLTVKWGQSYGELIKRITAVLDKQGLAAKITPLAIYQPEDDKYISVHLQFDQAVEPAVMTELERLGEK